MLFIASGKPNEYQLPADQTPFPILVTLSSDHLLAFANQAAPDRDGKDVVRFSLSELLAETEADMLIRALRKDLDLQLDIAPRVPQSVTADPQRIRQVLHDILGRAITCGQGPIRLTVDFKDNALKFTLQDGASHPSIIEQSGDRIGLREKTADQSRACVVSIPLAGETLRAKAEETPLLMGARVLVVDDAKDNQFIFENFLVQAGAEPACANNGQEAIDMIERHSFDAVLMDIRMPVMDGIEAMHILRSRGFHKPIIALTAHAMTGQNIRAIEAGFTDCVTKPITRERLVNLIYKCLN